MEKQKTESEKVHEVSDKAAPVIPVEASDNLVSRKLPRGGRYFDSPKFSERGGRYFDEFDPPNSFSRTCFRCGEGHSARKCTAEGLRKPCYKCGRRNHNVKRCAKRKACLICKKGGHRANTCPERHPGKHDPNTCLKCGDVGHDMFSCKGSYSADDLKDIQCYICQNFGHLCCVEYTDSGPAEVSCYRCGQLGHSGLECSESSVAVSRTSCYTCGEEGHLANTCSSLTDGGGKKYGLVTAKKRGWNRRKARSLPNDCNGSHTNQDIKWISDQMESQAPATNDHVTLNGSEHKPDGQTSLVTVRNNPCGSPELHQRSFSASQLGTDSSDAIQPDNNC